ncbi:MAG: TonB-dependent receptor [Armatimonadetes bacterium]|nr:TonB-dependent receptor [Armatimonadota bacterium]
MLAVLCLLLILPAVADEPAPTEELPEMEVSVQRYRQPKDDVAAALAVIDRKDLDKRAGESLRDVLADIPGFDIRPQGSAGAQAGISLRGSRTEQILVLIDGRRVNTAQGGGVDFSNLPLDSIERIEILRGGGSALYGSDPVGGVINIVTRKSGGGGVETHLSWGSFDTYDIGLGSGQTIGRGNYRVDFDRFVQTGDFEFKDNQGVRQHRGNNRLLRTDLRAQGGYDFGAGGALTAGFGIFFDPTGAFPVDANHRNRLLGGEVLAVLDGPGAHRGVAGLDFRRETIRSTNDGRHHRTTAGIFGSYELAIGPVTLLPSLRVDGQTGERPIVSPKFGLVGRAARNLKVRANAGRSFRAPSFDDLYWPEDAFARGNPLLTPEHSTEWDVGLDWQTGGGGTVSVGYFNRSSRDLIVWQPGAGNKWMPQNLSSVRFQGIETSFELPLFGVRGLTVRGGYYFLKATTHSGTAAEQNKQLVGHPVHQGSAGICYEQRRWLADLGMRTVGARFTTAANTQTLPSYAVLDLVGRWRPDARTELRVEALNLLNTSYRTVLDYPVPGLELRFTGSRRF